MESQASDLRSAFILLKCSKQSHKDCRNIRDKLMNEIGNVQEAYTTNASIYDEKWCVAASALIDVKHTKKIEKKLWSLKVDGKRPIGIKNAKLLVDDQ